MATIEQIVKVKQEIGRRIHNCCATAEDLAVNDACNTLIDRAFQPVDTEREDKMVDDYLAKQERDAGGGGR